MLTSRRMMRVRGEYEFVVPPLALPPLSQVSFPSLNPHQINDYPAVQFFVERIKLVKPEFNLTPALAVPIVQICHSLEGLPLALELAAPRLKLLSPEALLARLEQRLSLLTTSSQDVPARQRTMRASIEWSYSLLNPSEQTLLNRLSLFPGGWSLEAAEAICGNPAPPLKFDPPEISAMREDNILDALSELVAHSLVVVSSPLDEPAGLMRYRLLEPIRQYAYEQLLATAPSEELEQLQQRHCHYYLELAQAIDTELSGVAQDRGLQRQERDYPNIRAALSWALSANQTELALQLAGTLSRYWMMRNQNEGQFWLEAALNRRIGQENPEVAAKALYGLGNLVYMGNDFVRSQAHFEEVLELYQQSGNKAGRALALRGLAATYSYQNKLAESISLQQESLSIYQELNDKLSMAGLLSGLGINYLKQVELEAAQQSLEKALQLLKTLGNRRSAALTLGNLATVEFEQGKIPQAKAHFLESLAVFRELGDNLMMAFMLHYLGNLALLLGNLVSAKDWLEESFKLYQSQGSGPGMASVRRDLGRLFARQGDISRALALLSESQDYFQTHNIALQVVEGLEALAEIALNQMEPDRAVILSAASATQRNQLKIPALPSLRFRRDHILKQARAELGEVRYESLWSYGTSLSYEEALTAVVPSFKPELEMKNLATPKPDKPEIRSTGLIEDLTRREIEVLGLVARGLTNAGIAETLSLSKYTVSTHLHSINSKLGVSSRTAAVHLGRELDLI
jgi:predicted ATPase/DNA-binding NarL/FixJ family response regulator